jgi:transcriptional regulator with XRE-family HTH domain
VHIDGLSANFTLTSIIYTMAALSLSDRLLKARKDKSLSQQELAKLAKVHFTNVGKYERGEAVPSADVFNRIAKALQVSPDFLLNGTLQDKSADAISDEELLSQFRKIEQLPANKKKLVKEFLDAFIFKSDLQKQLAS